MYQGKKIRLIAMEFQHCEFVRELLNDQGIAHSEGRTEGLISEQQQTNWYKSVLNSENQYLIITLTESTSPIGYATLKLKSLTPKTFQLALKIHPEYQSKGLGADVVKTLANICFYKFEAHRLNTNIISVNTKSLELFTRKCFWRIEGREVESKYLNGSYQDNLCVAILRKEFFEIESDTFYNPFFVNDMVKK